MSEEPAWLLAQTLAPRLYKLFGVPPEEMGFPIYETKEEVDTHLERQFNPVAYWCGEAESIAKDMLSILRAGGAKLDDLDTDAMLEASKAVRPDFNGDDHLSADELTSRQKDRSHE